MASPAPSSGICSGIEMLSLSRATGYRQSDKREF
jgi:hypothetical protein